MIKNKNNKLNTTKRKANQVAPQVLNGLLLTNGLHVIDAMLPNSLLCDVARWLCYCYKLERSYVSDLLIYK